MFSARRTAPIKTASCVVFFILAAASASAIQVTAPGDPITGVSATSVGGDGTIATAGLGAGQFPAGEPPANAIDGLFGPTYPPGTKYLNFGAGAQGVSSATKGVGTGFYVTPASGSSVVNAIQVATANDAENRDPLTVSLEGSNATGADLNLGSSWTLIQPSINLGIDSDPGRYTLGPIVPFANSTAYTSYRVLVQSQRGSENSVQYGELNLLFIPEPSSLVSIGVGAAVLLAIARRPRAA
jgi:hypothetical protein